MSGKVIPSTLSKKETDKMFDLLSKKISSLKKKKEVSGFLSDVLTSSERVMVFRRLQIAKMLLEGKTYFEIKKSLNVGVETIRGVRNKLDGGSGGYLNFIKKL